MATSPLPIWKLKDPAQAKILRSRTEPMNISLVSDPATQELINHMVKAMYAAKGIGLAAPQIGQPLRLAVIAKEVQDRAETLVMINPVLTQMSSLQESLEEGCLSIPKVFGLVPRSQSLVLTAVDRHGLPYTLLAEGLLARVIQHEFDHLNGKLFIDRATAITDGKHLL